VEQSGISLNVQAGALAETISAVSPISIAANVSTSVLLRVTVAQGTWWCGPQNTHRPRPWLTLPMAATQQLTIR
jgi:hypothetical protein